MKKMKTLIIIILVVAGFLAWARYFGTKGLIIKEYGFKDKLLPSQFVGKKIVHFSDLHYGSTIFKEELDTLVEKINIQKPDLIFFSGDLVDKDYKMKKDDYKIISDALSKLDATLGKYAVKGNHDYVLTDFKQLMDDSKFKLLVNSHDLIYLDNNTPIIIAGLSSPLKEKINLKTTFSYIKEDDPKKHFIILLSHEPDTLKQVRKYDINLMISGHSHGGQVRFPFMKALITPKGSKIYFEDHYIVDETNLYISSGIGTSEHKIRFFNRPSFNLIRLYNK